MAEIRRPPEAFALSGTAGLKREAVRDPDYLAWVRRKGCAVCGKPAVAAHLRASSLPYGKGHTAMGRKPDDDWSLPLCPHHHTDGPDAQHKGAEVAFWQRFGLDPFALALALNRAYRRGDEEAARLILAEARRTAQTRG